MLKQQQDIERLHNERRNLIMGIAQKNIQTENENSSRIYKQQHEPEPQVRPKPSRRRPI